MATEPTNSTTCSPPRADGSPRVESTASERTGRGRVRVCLFAGMAAAAGCRHLDVDWTAGTVADLRTEIARRQPAIASLLARSAIAVDGRYAVDGESIHEGADVAVIPPVSGG